MRLVPFYPFSITIRRQDLAESFSFAAAFIDSLFTHMELPTVLFKLDSNLAAIATNPHHRGFPLNHSYIFILESLKNLTMCLPIPKFPFICDIRIYKTKEDFIKLHKDLSGDKYRPSFELCAISYV